MEGQGFCFSCHVAQLETFANFYGYTLRPISQVSSNLPAEYLSFFIGIFLKCNKDIEDETWKQLPLIDQLPYETTLRALLHDFNRLLEVGMQPNTPEGTQRVIILMRGIKNLLVFLNSIKSE